MEEVEIVEVKESAERCRLLVTGFVGAGLVGTIAANQIAEGLKLEEIGYVRSKFLPPAVLFTKGSLRHAFRIYAKSDQKLMAAVCELPVRGDGLQPIANSLVAWTEKKSIKEILVLDGVAARGLPKMRKTYWAAKEDRSKELAAHGIEPVKKGYIGGLGGAILSECLSRKLTGVALLTPAAMFIPDSGGAAQLLKSFNKCYGFHVPTENLEKEAADIREQLQQIAKQYKKTVTSEQKRYAPEILYT